MKRILLCALVLALAACTTPPTVYQPAAQPGAMGWRQTQIEADRYRVSFRANPDLAPPQVEDMARRRAAEIARQAGATWFRVVNVSTERAGGSGNRGTGVGVGGSTGSYGSSVGLGLSFDLSPDSRYYETTMEILLGHGPKPDDSQTYDVASLLEHLPR